MKELEMKINNHPERKKEFITQEPFIVDALSTEQFAKEVPPKVLETFGLKLGSNGKIEPLEGEDHILIPFENPGVIIHPDGSKTFVVYHQTQEGYDDFYHYSQYLSVFDSFKGKHMWWGEVRYVPGPIREDLDDNQPLIDTPYIDNVETEEAYRGKGLGARRYLIMDQLAMEKWGKHLRAGEDTTNDAIHVWKKFMAEGRARKVEGENESYAYEFIR